jgi:hypothetical protein
MVVIVGNGVAGRNCEGWSMNSSDRTPEVQQEADLGLAEPLADAKKLVWRLDFDGKFINRCISYKSL